MTAVTTNHALEVLADLVSGGQVLWEPVEFDAGTDRYTLSREWDTGISEVMGTLNGNEGHTFVSGTDYTQDAPDVIDWSPAGDEPDDGTTFYVTYDRPTLTVDQIAVGSGSSPVTREDTTMQDSLYSTTPDAIFPATDDGNRVYTIVVTGGTEIPAGSSVGEFGLFDADGNMLYHETRDAITISQGVTQEFRVRFDISQV